MSFALTLKTADALAVEAQEALRAQIVSAIDARVEAAARARGYNSAAHLAGYVSSSVPDWAAEAKAFVTWRDQVWQTAFRLQAQYAARKTAPTPDEVLAALPVWKR